MSLKVVVSGLARLSRRVWRRFVRGSREISLVPSLHRASTDALIVFSLFGTSCRLIKFRVNSSRSLQSTNEFIRNYTQILRDSVYSISTVYIIAFDTIWSLALMLNKTEEMRMATVSRKNSEFEKCNHLYGELVPLDEFNYSNAFMGCVMKENFYKVNFTGVSVCYQRGAVDSVITHSALM